jgi:hypothetical protein
MKKVIKFISIIGVLYAGSAKGDALAWIQGPAFVDLTLEASVLQLDVQGRDCGLELTSNQPALLTDGFAALEKALKIEIYGKEITPALGIRRRNLSYAYAFRRPYGTRVKISTLGGETLARAIETAFTPHLHDLDPKVIVTLIPCNYIKKGDL